MSTILSFHLLFNNCSVFHLSCLIPFDKKNPHFNRPIVYPLQVPWYSGMFALGGEWAAGFPFFDALCDYVMYMSSYGIDRTSILDPICVEQDAIIKKVHLFILKHQRL